MPIKRLVSESCTGCKICVDVCPEDVLRMEKGRKKAYIAYPEDCVACTVCEWFCPMKCIEVSVERARPVPMPY